MVSCTRNGYTKTTASILMKQKNIYPNLRHMYEDEEIMFEEFLIFLSARYFKVVFRFKN